MGSDDKGNGDEHGTRRPSQAKLHDPNVTFEEYYYHAGISRAHPSESSGSPSTASTTWTAKYNPFSKGKASVDITGTVNEKSSNDLNRGETWHDVSNEEYVRASRALRTASWGAIFYLITTDILGPFTTAYIF